MSLNTGTGETKARIKACPQIGCVMATGGPTDYLLSLDHRDRRSGSPCSETGLFQYPTQVEFFRAPTGNEIGPQNCGRGSAAVRDKWICRLSYHYIPTEFESDANLGCKQLVAEKFLIPNEPRD